ncbi:MAG: hypothetical protein CM15mP83_8410 [Flavobacteriaceae bacterium]|nr:MAG: hypothetical protein CM15mP83_8410 [Flavobacteriaceae bacterium]
MKTRVRVWHTTINNCFSVKAMEDQSPDTRTSKLLLTKEGFEIGHCFSNNESALHFSFYQQASQRLNILFENINLSDFILPKPKEISVE